MHRHCKQGMYNEARKRPDEATAWYEKILEDGSADQVRNVGLSGFGSNKRWDPV